MQGTEWIKSWDTCSLSRLNMDNNVSVELYLMSLEVYISDALSVVSTNRNENTALPNFVGWQTYVSILKNSIKCEVLGCVNQQG